MEALINSTKQLHRVRKLKEMLDQTCNYENVEEKLKVMNKKD